MQPPPPFPVALLAERDEAAQILRHAEETLNQFAVPFVAPVLSGRHDLARVIAELEAAGASVFIVADASRDPLAAAVARLTLKPVLAVPVATPDLPPLDALRASTAAAAAPVAALAIGKPGAINAALLAIAILANTDRELAQKLDRFRADQTNKVLTDRLDT
jgi:5-(carboxyamino)imidazole ribonucleotide mutase